MPIRQPSRQPATHSFLLDGEDVESASSLDDTDISQTHNLTVEELTSTSVLDDGRLTTTLRLEELTSLSVLDDSNITQTHNLTTEELTSTSTLDDAAITQSHVLTSEDIESFSVLDDVDITLVPSQPSNLVVSRSNDYLSTSLTWDSVQQATLYGIYRANDEQSTYTQIDTTASTSYTDNHGNAKRNYAYKVSALVQSTEGRKTIGQHTAGSESNLPA